MNKTKKIAYTGIFVALVMALGYSLLYIPNIELVTLIIFLSGYFMGIRIGSMVGMIGEFLFSTLNPFGSGLLFPPMLMAQVIAMTFVGFTGGLIGKYLPSEGFTVKYIFVFTIAGFSLTLIYDIFVSAAYPVSAGFGLTQTIGIILSGIIFSALHITMNTLVFSLLLPIIVIRLNRSRLFYG
ncbi:MAG: ECF transporter S component [Candidatus Marinimicrobia bacterium]|nr:ECF transporter S component [Candidatus Neomarinimicrobiota bacterium]